MFSKEQKDIALRLYHQTESVTKTIRILVYPTRRNLYKWLCESKSVNSNFQTSMISIILRRMPSFGICPY